MNSNDFQSFPDTSKVWVFSLASALDDTQVALIDEKLSAFISEWTSHQRQVEATFQILERRFLVVAAQVPGDNVSGCGIDKLFKFVQEMFSEMRLTQLQPDRVFYRDSTAVVDVSKQEFRKLLDVNQVDKFTPVFNLGVQTLADLREGRWEAPLQQSIFAKRFLKEANA